MAKRLPDHSNEESQLRKKIKLEYEIILDKMKYINKEIGISEHKVERFLLIFHLLMETANSEESLDNTDGIVSDTMLKIVSKVSKLLKNNIDSLKIPEILKIALKKIKSFFNLQTDQNAEHTGESNKASETSRDGSEEHREQESQKQTI